MQIIFVIQVILSTCQYGRFYRSPDGVKNIDAFVNLFFTGSRLLSYITHFARGYRVMLVLAVFFAIGITSLFAQTAGDYQSVGSGNWNAAGTWARYNGSAWITSPAEGWPGQNSGTGAITIQDLNDITITGNLTTNTVGTIIINGTLTFSGDWTVNLNTAQFRITAGLIPAAKVILKNKSELKLPAGAVFYVANGGLEGACSNNTQIYIGSDFFSCQGGGGSIGNFDDLYTPIFLSVIPAARCGMGAVNLGATSSAGSTISWFATSIGGTSLATGTSFTTPIISTTTTYYAEAKNIITGYVSSPRTTAIATINTNPTLALTSGAGTNAQNICVNTQLTDITYAVGGSATGATVSVLPAGLTGVYNSGVFTISGTPTVSGTFNYTVTTTGGCGSVTATGTITVTPSVVIPVFALGSSSARDQGAVSVTYTATASNNTGITYSLDAASLAGGNTINSSTGEVTYTAIWSWKSIITATATGCNGPKTADHVVGVNWCYALFTANGALSCAGASTITGDVGTFVGATTGFTAPAGPGILLPPGHIDAEASAASAQAAAQTVAVYNDLAAIPCTETHSEITLAGPTTLTPNVYCYGSALTITGEITLDGGPNAVFIFNINGALTTNTGSKIIMAGGASFRNVYWRVYGAVVLSGLEFKGTIVNEGAFTVNTGAALEGRALSINGAIAITNNAITSDCYPLFSVPDNTKPIFVPPTDIGECVENLSNIAYNPLTTAINPDRPDYYTFSDIDTRLDLNTSLFSDDEPLTCPSNFRWQIDFSPASDLNPPYNLVSQPPITGFGQPSEHIGNILFPGDGVNFNPVVHHITWWIKDCAGNESPPQTRSITINPRPRIVKVPL